MTVAAEHDVGSTLSTSAKIISGFIIFIALCSLFLPIRYFFFYNQNYFRQVWAHHTFVPDQVTLSTPLYNCIASAGYQKICLMGFRRTENYDRVVEIYSFVPTAYSKKIIDEYNKAITSLKADPAQEIKFTAFVYPDHGRADWPEVYAILDNSLPSFVYHSKFLISFIICGGLCVLILRWVVKFTKSVLKRLHTKKLPAEGNPA